MEQLNNYDETPDFKKTFEKYAVDGAIGDPYGRDGYCYIRVSTDEQAKEGKSGLHRQIEHVHQKAAENGIRIPWKLVYADDESGFQLERPELQRLLADTLLPGRKSNDLVIEALDRLSRNADWHQGWLIEQFQKTRGMTLWFWKAYNSRIERAVFGALGQEGMEDMLQKMRDGRRLKIERGSVNIGKEAPYGYQKKYTGHKRDATLILLPEEAHIMKYAFDQIAYHGWSANHTAVMLMATYGPPRSAKTWTQAYVTQCIQNPVYKGKFTSNRWKFVPLGMKTINGKMKKAFKKEQTPPEQWRFVDVEPLVSEEEWALANEMIQQSRVMSSRNAKHSYLLTGLVYCDVCGHAVNGSGWWNTDHTKFSRQYKCSSTRKTKAHQDVYNRECPTYGIRGDVLEDAVWDVVSNVVYYPEILLEFLDTQYESEENQRFSSQIEYLQAELQKKFKSNQNDRILLDAGAYTIEEFKERHQLFKDEKVRIETEIQRIKGKMITPEKREEQKRRIQDISDRARMYQEQDGSAPEEFKKTLIKMVCRKIWVNQLTMTMKIEGEIGTQVYCIPQMGVSVGEDGNTTSIVNTSDG